MKVKLLKKIRKRYSIIKINEINEDNPYEEIGEEKFGVPFYKVKSITHYILTATFEEARETLIGMIREKYRKDKEPKRVKVWGRGV